MRPARAVASSMLANGLILGCGILTGVLSARLLEPQGRGILATVVFWPQLIASLGTVSFNEAATYRIGQNPSDADSIAAAALRAGWVLSAVSLATTLLLIPILLGPSRVEWWSLARTYAIVFIPANLASLALLSWDQGKLRFNAYNGFRLAVPVLYLLGLVILWAAGLVTVPLVVAASLVGVVFVAVVQLVRARSLLRQPAGKERIRDLLGLGLSFHGATALMILSGQADRIVVLGLFDDVTIGYYVAAFALASLGLTAVGMAFHTVLLPTLSGSSDARRTDLLVRGLRAAMLVLVLTTILVALAAPRLIVFFFGAPYAPAGGVARLLTVALCLVALRTVTVLSLRGLGDGQAGAVAELIGLAVFGIVCIPLGLRLGPEGMALAIVLAAIPSLGYLVHRMKTRHGVPPGAMWGLRRETVRDCLGAIGSFRHR